MTVTLAVLAVSTAAALLVFVLSVMRSGPDPIDPVAHRRALVRRLARCSHVRRFLRQRLDRRTAGGLILTVSFLAVFAVALITGLLLDMVGSSTGVASWDDEVASWGAANADSTAVGVFVGLTYLGDTLVVVGALLVGGLVDFVRHRRIEVFAFLGVVIVGEKLIVNGLKEIVGRERPDVLQLVGWLGPSFPSGHAAAAAAVWPALALVLTRGGSRAVRAAAAAAAALIAFAVAASRAFLGVHWLTDVVAGVTIGYGWFVVAAVMFGGRTQRLGDPVTAARRPRGSEGAPRSAGGRSSPWSRRPTRTGARHPSEPRSARPGSTSRAGTTPDDPVPT